MSFAVLRKGFGALAQYTKAITIANQRRIPLRTTWHGPIMFTQKDPSLDKEQDTDTAKLPAQVEADLSATSRVIERGDLVNIIKAGYMWWSAAIKKLMSETAPVLDVVEQFVHGSLYMRVVETFLEGSHVKAFETVVPFSVRAHKYLENHLTLNHDCRPRVRIPKFERPPLGFFEAAPMGSFLEKRSSRAEARSRSHGNAQYARIVKKIDDLEHKVVVLLGPSFLEALEIEKCFEDVRKLSKPLTDMSRPQIANPDIDYDGISKASSEFGPLGTIVYQAVLGGQDALKKYVYNIPVLHMVYRACFESVASVNAAVQRKFKFSKTLREQQAAITATDRMFTSAPKSAGGWDKLDDRIKAGEKFVPGSEAPGGRFASSRLGQSSLLSHADQSSLLSRTGYLGW